MKNNIKKTVAAIETEARRLSPPACLELVDAILDSLDEPTDRKIDSLWSKEAEERLTAYRQGYLISIPMDEVLTKYRTP